jgi:hypothetical protein
MIRKELSDAINGIEIKVGRPFGKDKSEMLPEVDEPMTDQEIYESWKRIKNETDTILKALEARMEAQA